MIDVLNGLGSGWWRWLTAMAWQAALLALVVWAADLLLRRRGWPQVRYALWALVLVKLLVPPSFALPSGVVGRLLPEEAANVASQASPPAAPVAPAPVEAPAASGAAYERSVVPATVAGSWPAPSPPAVALPAGPSVSPEAWAMLAAVTVSLLLLFWLISRALRLRRMIRAAAAEPPPAWVGEVLARAAKRVGLRHVPRVVITDAVGSAAVFGVLRPVLLLPRGACEDGSPLRTGHVMLHELAHVKRGDLLANTAQALMQVAFWFHPAVWLAARRLRHLRELCCDATVSRLLRERTPEYRETLAEAARSMIFGAERPGLGLLGLFESASRLRQRLEHLDGPIWRHGRLKAVAALLAAGVTVACIVPMARGAARPSLPSLYEKARGAGDLKIGVQGETFKVNTVVRWGSDGAARYEDGRGNTPPVLGYPEPDYSSQARWMDIANVQLSPPDERYDLVELRVFDHATRELLQPDDGTAVGFDCSRSLVGLRSIGRRLPDSVDVWFRLVMRPAGGHVWSLPANPGATVALGSDTVTLHELHAGRGSYGMTEIGGGPEDIAWTGFDEDEHFTTVVFGWRGRSVRARSGSNSRYQICAITTDGRRVVPDYPHFVAAGLGATQVYDLPVSPNELARIEFRPFTGREVFYFEDVRLPDVGDTPLEAPPACTFAVGGRGGTLTSDDWAPVRVRLTMEKGRTAHGVSGGALGRVMRRQGPPPDANSAATAVYEVNGLSVRGLEVEMLDADGDLLLREGNRSRGTAWGSSYTVGYNSLGVPLSQIATVRMTLGDHASAHRSPDGAEAAPARKPAKPLQGDVVVACWMAALSEEAAAALRKELRIPDDAATATRPTGCSSSDVAAALRRLLAGGHALVSDVEWLDWPERTRLETRSMSLNDSYNSVLAGQRVWGNWLLNGFYTLASSGGAAELTLDCYWAVATPLQRTGKIPAGRAWVFLKPVKEGTGEATRTPYHLLVMEAVRNDGGAVPAGSVTRAEDWILARTPEPGRMELTDKADSEEASGYEMRVYDVRDLIAHPDWSQSAAARGDGADDGDALRESAEELARLIKAACGEEKCWSVLGRAYTREDEQLEGFHAGLGEVFLRTDNPGHMLVNQTPSVHACIEKLLTGLRAGGSLQVELSVHARVFDRSAGPIDPAKLTEKGAAERAAWQRHATVTLANGQQGPVLEGLSLRPVVTEDRRSVFVELTGAPPESLARGLSTPDGSPTAFTETGPLAVALAKDLMGDSAPPGLDLEGCTVAIVVRPRIVMFGAGPVQPAE